MFENEYARAELGCACVYRRAFSGYNPPPECFGYSPWERWRVCAACVAWGAGLAAEPPRAILWRSAWHNERGVAAHCPLVRRAHHARKLVV